VESAGSRITRQQIGRQRSISRYLGERVRRFTERAILLVTVDRFLAIELPRALALPRSSFRIIKIGGLRGLNSLVSYIYRKMFKI